MSDKSESTPRDKDDEVLDLIDGSRKPSRRERQRLKVEAATKPPEPSALEKAKSEALDLFSEDKSKARKKAKPAAPKELIGSISKVLEKTDPAMVPTPAPAAAAAPAPAAQEEEIIDSGDPKLIIIKPPILVPELAKRLGLKPFNVMAD
ncbi:MAG TPA: hypothetical protein VFY13_04355, partial [Luteolibacter sp.]|nr:hypothetical protein [Luteolibacter sp.]